MMETGSPRMAPTQQQAHETLDNLADLVRNELPRVVESLQRIDAALTEASDIAWQYGPLRPHTQISQAQGVLAALYAAVEAMEPYTDWV